MESCVFGAGSEVPASVWNGYLIYLAIWDLELSGDDIAILASV